MGSDWLFHRPEHPVATHPSAIDTAIIQVAFRRIAVPEILPA